MISPHKILDWAAYIMPSKDSDWFAAMTSEIMAIPVKTEQYHFAFGCLAAALSAAVHSRKGLQYIARICGAGFLLMISLYVIYAWPNFQNTPEAIAAGNLTTKLCFYYIGGAALLITSVKGLRVYTLIGLCAASLSAIYLQFGPRNTHSHLPPHDFLIALNLEALCLIAALFFASLYLSWLYTPEYDDA